jgi:hypothetical protein
MASLGARAMRREALRFVYIDPETLVMTRFS